MERGTCIYMYARTHVYTHLPILTVIVEALSIGTSYYLYCREVSSLNASHSRCMYTCMYIVYGGGFFLYSECHEGTTLLQNVVYTYNYSQVTEAFLSCVISLSPFLLVTVSSANMSFISIPVS